MSWNAGTGGGGWDSSPAAANDFEGQDGSGFDNGGDTGSGWDCGPATTNDFTGQTESGFDNSGETVAADGFGGTDGNGNADGGHHGGGNTGACFNCGELGHMKSACKNPTVAREFTGVCRLCTKAGHRAVDCPDATPPKCKNCAELGHFIKDCKNPRLIDRDQVADVLPHIAWAEMEQAIKDEDLDAFKTALAKYFKRVPNLTYCVLENLFRGQGLGIYIIALPRELSQSYTNMDLQGNLDRTYTISYRWSPKPKRPKENQAWPTSVEDNMERLKDAGLPVDRRVPLCGNCDTIGHIAKFCTEEKKEAFERVLVVCFNCEKIGHRIRDCPKPRPDKFACRNCKKSGHISKECPEPRSAEGVECKKCSQIGHFARNCPTGGGGDDGLCRNCGKEGHRAKDCTEPRDMSKVICRNCDETGHGSKECPKPRDYSRVECQNCKKKGHTKVRCKEPFVGDDGNEDIGNNGKVDNYGGKGFDKGGSSSYDGFAPAPTGGDGW